MRRLVVILALIGFFSLVQAENLSDSDTLIVYNSSDSIVVIGNRIATSVRNLAYSYQTISGELVQRLSCTSSPEMVW